MRFFFCFFHSPAVVHSDQNGWKVYLLTTWSDKHGSVVLVPSSHETYILNIPDPEPAEQGGTRNWEIKKNWDSRKATAASKKNEHYIIYKLKMNKNLFMIFFWYGNLLFYILLCRHVSIFITSSCQWFSQNTIWYHTVR